MNLQGIVESSIDLLDGCVGAWGIYVPMFWYSKAYEIPIASTVLGVALRSERSPGFSDYIKLCHSCRGNDVHQFLYTGNTAICPKGMNGTTLFQLISACVGIVGSIFFAVGVMRQSTEAMAKLSGTYFDWNPHMPPALAQQKADYLFGGGLILLAFALQLGAFFAVTEPVLSPAQSAVAPWIAAAGTVIAFFLLRAVSRRLARHFERQVNAWLKRKAKGESAA